MFDQERAVGGRPDKAWRLEAPIHQLAIHVTSKKRRGEGESCAPEARLGDDQKDTGDELTLRSPKESITKAWPWLAAANKHPRTASSVNGGRGGYLGGSNPARISGSSLSPIGACWVQIPARCSKCLGASCSAVTAASCMNATSQLVFTARMEHMRWH